MNNSLKVAEQLLRIKAVFLNPKQPFTWASGIKSPIYCDNRLILSDVKARKITVNALADMIRAEYPQAEMIIGTATAGIAPAALVADLLDLPMGYVRSRNKDHGRENIIEGKLEQGAKVVVVEDLISTANSAIEVAKQLRANGAEVLGIASIFSYGMQKSNDNLAKAELVNHSLCNFEELIEQAVKDGHIKTEDKAKLIAFRNNPDDQSWLNQ